MQTTLFKTLARYASRLLSLGMAVGFAATLASVGPAAAHGEKSQAAFLRMRTLNWYDLKWSKHEVKVNEEFEITGKLHIMNAWPAAVAEPHVAFLNTGMPGPVAVRKLSFIGEQFVPRSVSLDKGKTYAFRMVLKGRREGRWHIHVQLSVETGGPIPGPGEYVQINGSMKDFVNPITLLNGEVVDLEQYGINKIYVWHFLWMIAGAAYIGWWFSKGGFVSRFNAVADGRADEIVTPADRTAGAVVLGVTLLVTIVAYAITSSQYPNTIPLQAGNIRNLTALPDEAGNGLIKIKYVRGTYQVPGRELVASYIITNNTKEPLRIGEFGTAGLRFLNPDVYTSKVDYPDYLLADKGLTLSDNAPIGPGETKELTVTVKDARWDTERLSGLAYDVDSSFAGLMFFFTPSGERYAVETGGFVIPTFLPV
jgi:methane/ammonia monooxygenase subunit B